MVCCNHYLQLLNAMAADFRVYNSANFRVRRHDSTANQATTSNTGTAQQAVGTSGTQNTYDANQQATQSSLAGLANQLSTGNVSSNYGLPQSVADWAQNQYNANTAPQTAFQQGSGSNQMQAGQQSLDLGLAAQSGALAVSNANSTLANLSNYAYNPTGSTSTTAQAQTGSQASTGTADTTTDSTGSSSDTDYGGLLDLLGYSLAGSGSSYLPSGLGGSTGSSSGGSGVPSGSGASAPTSSPTTPSPSGQLNPAAGDPIASANSNAPAAIAGLVQQFSQDPVAYFNQLAQDPQAIANDQALQNPQVFGNITQNGANVSVNNSANQSAQFASPNFTNTFAAPTTNITAPFSPTQVTNNTSSGTSAQPLSQAAQNYNSALSAYSAAHPGLTSVSGGLTGVQQSATAYATQAAAAYTANPTAANLSAMEAAQAVAAQYNGLNSNTAQDQQISANYSPVPGSSGYYGGSGGGALGTVSGEIVGGGGGGGITGSGIYGPPTSLASGQMGQGSAATSLGGPNAGTLISSTLTPYGTQPTGYGPDFGAPAINTGSGIQSFRQYPDGTVSIGPNGEPLGSTGLPLGNPYNYGNGFAPDSPYLNSNAGE